MIKSVGLSNNLQLLEDTNQATKVSESQQISFTDLLKDKISEVNNMKIDADKITQDFVLGNTDNIHQVMIATEKAKIALELTTAIQNKVVTAYKDVMRIQM